MRWMSVEFDRRCGTAQSEDCLQVYIPAVVSPANVLQFTTQTTQPTCTTKANATTPDDDDDDDKHAAGSAEVSAWWPVLSKYHGVVGWPTSAIILPGKTLMPKIYHTRFSNP